MQHPFALLKPEYETLLARMVVTRAADIDSAARMVLAGKDRYLEASQATGVPAALIGALDLREGSCNPHLGLGQGDPWTMVSTHVPRGKGPFTSWADAAKFYIHYDHLDVLQGSNAWTWAYVCWKGEAWNGFGPRNHGKHTGYLWSGTNDYEGGKYVADRVWSSTTRDQQVGIIPVMKALIELDASLAFGDPTVGADPSIPVTPQPPPVGIDGGPGGPYWLQQALNALGAHPSLLVDGNIGRRTRDAVRIFQGEAGLQVDGIAGALTIAAIEARLAQRGSTP